MALVGGQRAAYCVACWWVRNDRALCFTKAELRLPPPSGPSAYNRQSDADSVLQRAVSREPAQ